MVRVLVTNDDGIDAVGLYALARSVRDAGHDVVVVAPSHDHSGYGAALGPLHVDGKVAFRRTRLPGLDDVTAIAVDGPPGLCTLCGVLGGFGPPPDVVLSGINAGANTGRAILHSGTVGAALTAAQLGVPAVAISLALANEWQWPTAAELGIQMIDVVARVDAGAILNLNVPNVEPSELRGVVPATLSVRGTVQAVFGEPASGTLQLRFEPSTGAPPEDSDEALLAAGWATLSLIDGVRSAAADRLAEVARMLMPAHRARVP